MSEQTTAIATTLDKSGIDSLDAIFQAAMTGNPEVFVVTCQAAWIKLRIDHVIWRYRQSGGQMRGIL